MTYDEKKKVADVFLAEFYTTWDTLADTNSLHDADTEQEVIELADQRYLDDISS